MCRNGAARSIAVMTTTIRAGATARWSVVAYGALCYLAFLASFGYAVLFVLGIVVPRTVDHGIAAPLVPAIAVNLALLGVFAAQHSIMARPWFKRWWTRIVPPPVERSTFVLAASAALGLLCCQWRTIDGVVWDVGQPVARVAVWTIAAVGWLTVLATTFMINHFELFGLQQVFASWQGRRPAATGFRTPLLYRLVRHPMMLGFLLAFWAAPTMTAGHLLFAAATTVYILAAIRIEERDLSESLGDPYRRYRHEVPMVLPTGRCPRHEPPTSRSPRHRKLLTYLPISPASSRLAPDGRPDP